MNYDVKYDEITNFYFNLNQITSQITEKLSNVLESLDGLIKLDSFQGQVAISMKSYMNEVSKTLIASAIAVINEFANKSHSPNSYTSMDIVKSPHFETLGKSLQQSTEKNEALANQINAAGEREVKRYETLKEEWAQEREERGWLKTLTGTLEVVGGIFTIIGSLASIAATCGASTPLAVVGVTAGIGMIIHGSSDMAEGIQDIYYGSKGDPFTVAFNPVRDTIFAAAFGEEGKDKAWSIFGTTCAIVGTIATLGASGWAAGATSSAKMAATGACKEAVKAAGTKAIVEFGVKASITMVAGAGSGYLGKNIAKVAGASDNVADIIGIVSGIAGATATGVGMSKWKWSYEPGSRGIPNNACFVAGTKILTALGLVAIENIKAGYKVISTNVDTFEVNEKTVIETYIREVLQLVHLTINGELISTTVDHPFYVKNRGFISAGELVVNDVLIDVNGKALYIENIDVEPIENPVLVYNFQVEDFHTYHVGVTGVLVPL